MLVHRVAQTELPLIPQLHNADGSKYLADTAHAINRVGVRLATRLQIRIAVALRPEQLLVVNNPHRDARYLVINLISFDPGIDGGERPLDVGACQQLFPGGNRYGIIRCEAGKGRYRKRKNEYKGC